MGSGSLPPSASIFHAQDGSSGFTPTGNANFLLEGDGPFYIGILTPGSTTGGIVFMEPGDQAEAIIDYRHATDDMHFRVNDTEDVLKLHSTGDTSVGGELLITTPTCTGIGNICAGVYSPTYTDVSNTDNVTINGGEFYFMRIGNIVQVTGSMNIDPTLGAPTSTQFRLTIPIASNFTTTAQAAGTGAFGGTNLVPSQGMAVNSDPTNDEITVDFQAVSAGNTRADITFMYKIL